MRLRRDRAIARSVVTLVALMLLTGACGGGGPSDTGAEPTGENTPSEDPFALPPLEEPKDCPKPTSDLELTNYAFSWANEKGKPVEQFERCLAAPAGEPFTIAFENSKTKGVLRNLSHNVSVYADPESTQVIMKGEIIEPGKRTTYEVDALDAGLYLFKCDLHPNTMKGVLVVE